MTVPDRFAFLCVAISCLVAASWGKFCPREKRDGLECRGKEGQFKCGIFYKNLYGNDEITWIGALPDSIRKVRRTDPNLVETIFPKVNGDPVTEEYFTKWSNQCSSDEANSKCYLLMDQISNNRLDSCEKMIGNLDGKNTVGNQLCDQAIRFMNNRNMDTSGGIKNLELVFMHSECQQPWTSVQSDIDGPLVLEQKLCCDSLGKYERCDGQTYRKDCS